MGSLYRVSTEGSGQEEMDLSLHLAVGGGSGTEEEEERRGKTREKANAARTESIASSSSSQLQILQPINAAEDLDYYRRKKKTKKKKKKIPSSQNDEEGIVRRKSGDMRGAKWKGKKKRSKVPAGVQGSSSTLSMPLVSATGEGLEGKTITGMLFKYSEVEVSIVCVCHGRSFSPSGFLEHAGRKDLSHPLRQITVFST